MNPETSVRCAVGAIASETVEIGDAGAGYAATVVVSQKIEA